MGSYDVKDYSYVITLCNRKDVGTMKKKRKRKKENYFILSLLCLLVAGTPASPTASQTDFTCYPRRGLCFKRLGDNVFEYFDVSQICALE